MQSKSENIKSTSYNDATLDELFDSLRLRYQGNLKTSRERSELVFDSVQMMYYKCCKVNFRRCGSYIDSPDWMKKKDATINPKNKDDKCFQYAVTVALNYEEIKWDPERLSNIKPFINKYSWKRINYPSKTDDCKTFEKNNLPIALSILYIEKKKKYVQLTSQKLIRISKNK